MIDEDDRLLKQQFLFSLVYKIKKKSFFNSLSFYFLHRVHPIPFLTKTPLTFLFQ
jgi:hypothetical protein